MNAPLRYLSRQQFVLGTLIWIASGTVALVIGVLGAAGVIFASRTPGVFMAVGGFVWLMIGLAGAVRFRHS